MEPSLFGHEPTPARPRKRGPKPMRFVTDQKKCKTCKVMLPASEFSKHPQTRDGLNTSCKPCASKRATDWHFDNQEYSLASKREDRKRWSHERRIQNRIRQKCREYGIPFKNYDAFLNLFERKCAMCKGTKKLCIDHDHATGEVRGLLCAKCNFRLGAFEDSSFFELAKQYLKRELPGQSGVPALMRLPFPVAQEPPKP